MSKWENEFKVIKVALIDVADFNPADRTADLGLKGLKHDVEEADAILVPIHVIPCDGRYLLGDGHRRKAIAERLGRTNIPAMIYPSLRRNDLPELWRRLNATPRAVSAREWMEAYYNSHGKVVPPGVTAYNIKNCERIFGGRPGLAMLLEKRTAPTVYSLIRDCYGRLANYSLTPELSETTIGMWMIKYKMQQTVRTCLRVNSTRLLSKLHTKIKSGRDFPIKEL